MISNRHPVDALFEVREQIKKLEAQEQILRKWVLDNPHNLVGDDSEASVTSRVKETCRLADARMSLGMALNPYLYETVAQNIKLSEAKIGLGMRLAPYIDKTVTSFVKIKPRRTAKSRIPAGQYEWYAKYLKSPEWKQKRSAILLRDNWECAMCRSPATEVHHKHYDNLGNEHERDLISVCDECHALFHGA